MLKLVSFLAFITVAYAAVARYPPQPKPAEFANQEGCYISTLNRVLPYDQPYYPGDKCEEYFCESSTNETQQYTCGAVLINPGCEKAQDDLTKNYPNCCGTEVCPTTTVAPTTQASTTQASTTQASTTQAPVVPAQAQPSVAYASAKSASGQQPVTETYTSGPDAQASATAS